MNTAKMARRGAASMLLGVTLICRLTFGVAAAPDCDRSCLEGTAEKYLAAMLTHDPAKGPIAHGARDTENTVDLTLPDGL